MTDRKVRWGIIGTAGIARNAFIPAAKAAHNAVVLGVASRDAARARQYADENGIERSYGSYEDLLADPDIDAIYNPLPNDGHAPWSMAAARAGKATLCEKPIALNAAEAQTMIETFRAADVLLAEAFMYRYHPQHAIVKQMLADGKIGRLTAINAGFTYALPPTDTTNVRLDPTMGGGGLLDIGCYCVNLCRMMAGEPTSVTGQVFIGPQSGTDEAFAGTLAFPNGVVAVFDCGMRGSWRQTYSLVGTEGILTVKAAFRPRENEPTVIEYRRETGEFWQTIDQPEIIHSPAVNQYQLMVEDFSDAVLTGRKMTYDPLHSLGNMRVLDALIQSAHEGRRIDL